MKKVKEIDGCYRICPLQADSIDGPYCKHTFFENAQNGEDILSRDEWIPEKCPLRKEDLNITYKLKK